MYIYIIMYIYVYIHIYIIMYIYIHYSVQKYASWAILDSFPTPQSLKFKSLKTPQLRPSRNTGSTPGELSKMDIKE